MNENDPNNNNNNNKNITLYIPHKVRTRYDTNTNKITLESVIRNRPVGGGIGLFTARRFRKEFSQLLLNNIYFFFNTLDKECGKMLKSFFFFRSSLWNAYTFNEDTLWCRSNCHIHVRGRSRG